MRASIALRADHSELVRLQAFADEFARGCDVPDDERSRLLIILEELLINAVTHGCRLEGAGGEIAVALGLRGNHLRITFIDDGPAFDPLAVPELELDAADRSRVVGGLGIHIVCSLVHRARYRRKGGFNYLHLLRRIRLPNGARANICSA
jgi:serine/threonine-protein kinase RsbW